MSSILKKIFRVPILFLINILVLIISFIIPKSDKIIVVGGWFGKRFADNSKYFYLYLDKNKEELNFKKIIWITKSEEVQDELLSRGYQVFKTWSLRSVWYHFRAMYHVVDQNHTDINSFFSVRSKKINLWHGFPLKKIGNYTNANGDNKTNKYQKIIEKFTSRGMWADQILLATSKFSTEILGEAFGVTPEQMIVSNYPRTYDFLVENKIEYFSKIEEDTLYKIKKSKEEGYNILGYFPTFRDKKETLFLGTNDRKEIYGFLEYCENKKIKILGKFHFAGENDSFEILDNHKSFINLSSETDVYTYLSEVDVLITDYSSIYFDYLLLNRPIIFYPYDLEYYRDEDRGLIFNYEMFTPGPKSYTIKELTELLSINFEEFYRLYKVNYGDKANELKHMIFENTTLDIFDLITKIKEI